MSDSKVHTAAIIAGGRCTDGQKAAEHFGVDHRQMQMRTREGEAPKCKPVPLHWASRLALIDISRLSQACAERLQFICH
jgi:hypothetical protein